MQCTTHYVSLNIRFKDLCASLQKDFKTSFHRDVIRISEGESDTFIFQYGSVVSWNVEYDRQRYFIDYITRFSGELVQDSFDENQEFELVENITSIRVVNEILQIPTLDTDQEKLACSYAFAQSNNLDYFESSVEKLIKKTRYIPKTLHEKGKIEMSAKQISQLIGEILSEKHSINLHFNLLEKPDFFWEYSDLEKSYHTISRHLEVSSRVEIMNKKLAVLQELVEVLSDEQKHTYGSRLELIVIWLIVFEIVLSLVSIFSNFSH